MRLKVKVGCGIPAILKAKYGMKIGRQGKGYAPFEGRIGDRMGISRIII